MFKEFREFILKGNMMDLAVGVIIGAAFGKVVSDFTEFLLSTITFFTGSAKVGAVPLAKRTLEDGTRQVIDLGPFINSMISLLIVGFALFLVVKAYNTAKNKFEKPAEPETPETPANVKVLEEIRDLLKNSQN